MGDVQANAVNLQSSRESSWGVASSTWLEQEPNENGIDLGAVITTVSRKPISKNRRRKAGTTVGLDSGGTFQADLTGEVLFEFGEAFFFSSWAGPSSVYRPSAVVAGGSGGFTITDNNQSAEYPANTLVRSRGFADDANNGVFVVQSGSTDTLIRVNGLTAVAGPIDDEDNATVMVCGHQFAAGDLDVNASGNLVTTAFVLTDLPLEVGMIIGIGGDDAATSFSNAQNRGLARVTSIAAHEVGLAWRDQAFVTEDNSATTNATVRIFYGPWLRDVGVDDADYLDDRTYTFETTFENLSESVPGTAMHEYAVGNYCNEWTMTFQVESLVTCELGFVGKDTEPPVETASRKSGASAVRRVVQDDPFNTSADFARLLMAETDETGVSTDFESLSISLKNNVSPKKLLGTLGAAKISIGRFEADITAACVFNNAAVPTAIRESTALALQFGLRNDDCAFVFDMPNIRVMGGKKTYPANQLVMIQETIEAVEDPDLGFSLSLSLFPYLPDYYA